MEEQPKLSESTNKLLNALSEQTGRSPQEIHDILLCEGLRSLDGKNPQGTHSGEVLVKLRNMGNKLELMLRPPGYPPLDLIPKILIRRR